MFGQVVQLVFLSSILCFFPYVFVFACVGPSPGGAAFGPFCRRLLLQEGLVLYAGLRVCSVLTYFITQPSFLLAEFHTYLGRYASIGNLCPVQITYECGDMFSV